jgi:hypothetical protein
MKVYRNLYRNKDGTIDFSWHSSKADATYASTRRVMMHKTDERASTETFVLELSRPGVIQFFNLYFSKLNHG